MVGFIGRWLSDSLRIGLALVLGVAAMQIPALTHAYDAALQQVGGDARRDIEQRKEKARQFYGLATDTDEGVIAALRQTEPSNAEGLAVSVDKAETLRRAHERIERAPPLLQPLDAAWDLLSEPDADKRAVLRTAIGTHVPQLILGSAAATYGLCGLVLGLFLAQALLCLPGSLARRRRRRHLPA
jgi:hypothetical protein